jgi:ERCC4-type nuclease
MLKPEDITAIIDTREQQPLTLELDTIPGTLATGDYSVRGLEDLLTVERKSLDDLLGCMTSGRPRFERELKRMQAYDFRCVVVEADWQDLVKGRYRSRMQPSAATHTIASWTSLFNVPFQFCGRDRKDVEDFVSFFLFTTAKKLYERLGHLKNGCKQ